MTKYSNLGYLVNLSAKLMKYHLSLQLEEMNFTVQQWSVIKDLQLLEDLGAPENDRMAVSIAQRLDMDKPTISGIIKRLHDKGFIKKNPHSSDKRATVLKLTSHTRELLPQLEACSEQTIASATAGFSNDELIQLTDFLSRMTQNLKEEG